FQFPDLIEVSLSFGMRSPPFSRGSNGRLFACRTTHLLSLPKDAAGLGKSDFDIGSVICSHLCIHHFPDTEKVIEHLYIVSHSFQRRQRLVPLLRPFRQVLLDDGEKALHMKLAVRLAPRRPRISEVVKFARGHGYSYPPIASA